MASEATSLPERVARLGQELKQWEQQFAASHDGSKPTRDDIKHNASIASKYSEYHRLRGGNRATKSAKRPTAAAASKEARAESNLSKHACTPSKPSRIDFDKDDLDFNADQPHSTPADGKRAFIDPTPQKNGRVLGLFDVLPEDTTPSKKVAPGFSDSKPPLQPLEVNTVSSTPSKARLRTGEGDDVRDSIGQREALPHITGKHTRTPQSSSKRFLLDSFITPSKRRRLGEGESPRSETKHISAATPAFLQRNLATLTAVSEKSPVQGQASRQISASWLPSRRPSTGKRSLTRSFSSMIADIRRAEDDRWDEELEMIREMEAENEHEYQTMTTHQRKENILVRDSQDVKVLGPDGTILPSEDEGVLKEGLGRDGKPVRLWKKKGQKRQTRRVLMRPASKAKAAKPTFDDDISDAENGGPIGKEKGDIQDESGQPRGSRHETTTDSFDLDNYRPGANDELDGDERATKKLKINVDRRVGSNTESMADRCDPKERIDETNNNIVRKTVKKISATAHANFRRLKIRSSKGAKAAGKGRFGRGRK